MPKRVILSQGTGQTFSETEIDLKINQLSGKLSSMIRTISREKRSIVHDLKLQGAAVGKYDPKIVNTALIPTFSGGIEYYPYSEH